MKYVYPLMVWLASIVMANEIGMERVSPAGGMFVFLVLAWEVVREIKKNSEYGKKLPQSAYADSSLGDGACEKKRKE